MKEEDNMEIIPGLHIGLDFVVINMAKVGMVFLCILNLVLVKQESTMEKVVSIPIKGSLRILVWGTFVLTLVLTAIVMLF